jgi:acetyl-CoA carboxylase biotin carboxyl carrier protein
MDAKDLKRIVEIMNENDLAEVEIEEEGKRIRVRKKESGAATVVHAPALASAPATPVAAPAAEAPGVPEAPAAAAEEGLHTITAPMVGTFYRAPTPDADSYVEVGRRVGPDTVVCILEAMKVMNEIKAECSGEIVKVCVQNAEAVEYGQALFVVRPG